MAENSSKIAEKALKNSRNSLLSLIKNYLVELHNYPEDKYPQAYLYALFKDIGLICEKIIIFGLVGYLFFMSLNFIVPSLQKFVYLGRGWYEVLFSVIGIGLVIYSLTEGYKWIRRTK